MNNNYITNRKNITNVIITYIRRHPLATSASLLHLTLMLCTSPYVLNTDYCSDYSATFPTTPAFNYLTVILGFTVSICIIIGVYHYYIPIVWYQYSSETKICFCFILSFYAIYIFNTYPRMYLLDGDYTALYDMATHGIPIFWQSYLTSVIYLGYYLILLHPLSIIVVEAFLFAAVFTYILDTCLDLLPTRKRTYRILLIGIFFSFLLLLSRISSMALIPHRILLWGIYAVYHVFTIFYNIIERNTSFVGTPRFYLHSALAGILAFWRTEAILFLIWMHVSFCFMLISKRKRNLGTYFLSMVEARKMATGTFVSILVYILMYIPQISANTQYYGCDYMLVNYTGFMQEMLLDENIDLSYNSASDDISCINSFTPLEQVKRFGSGAYHYASELRSGNCTLSGISEMEKNEYMESVENVIYHNPGLFIKSRFILFLKTNEYISEDTDGNDYYEKYLKGYGNYYYAVADRIATIGYEPVYFIQMLKQSANNIQTSGFCGSLCILLILIFETVLFSVCICNRIFLMLDNIFTTSTPIFTKWLQKCGLYLAISATGAVTFYLYRIITTIYGDLYNSLQPILETILLLAGIFLCVYNFINQQPISGCAYLFIFACCMAVFIFAPTDYWVYYTGLYACLYAILALNITYMLHNNRSFNHNF